MIYTDLRLSFGLNRAWRSRGRWSPPMATDGICIWGHHVPGRAHRGGAQELREEAAGSRTGGSGREAWWWPDPGHGGVDDADPGRGGRILPESWPEAGGAAAGEARGGHGGAAMRGMVRGRE
jgi:hypothetical protein